MNQKALEWIRQQSDAMVEELTELCNMNSSSEDRKGLEKVADWLEDYFAPIQTPCQRLSLPSYTQIDDEGVLSEQLTGPALRWDWPTSNRDGGSREGVAPPLLLSIHYDTVYGVKHPFQRCRRVEGDRMIGPGVIDAKGGIVILRYAAIAAKMFLPDTPLAFSIVLSPDEEIGSPATSHLWSQIAEEFGFAILFEPTMADGSWVSTRKGTGTLVFKIEGRAAHAGRNFMAGRNAIVHAASIIRALHQLNGIRENVTLNIGRIRGGDAVNVVPDLSVFRVNLRIADSEDQTWVEAQIRKIVEQYHTPDHGYRVNVVGGIHSPPKPMDPRTQHWMHWIEEEGNQLGQTIRWKPSGGASDGNKLQSLGLSNIDTFGPDGDGLHSDREWIDLTSLPRKACLVFRLMERYARESHSTASRQTE